MYVNICGVPVNDKNFIGVFDMDKLDVVKTDKPVFTLVETPYRYNLNAKSTILKDFLDTSFNFTYSEIDILEKFKPYTV